MTETEQGETGDFRQRVRAFAESEVRPQVADMDRRSAMPRELVDRIFGEGLMGIEIPAEHGGLGLDFVHVAVAIEELARVDPAVAVLVHVQNSLVINALLQFGDDGQKARFFPALASGTVGAFAQTERDAGSDSFALATRARLSGDHYLLDGRKVWITNAAEAGLFVVLADARAAGQQQKAVTCFLVEPGEGFTVLEPADKLGLRASSTCELALDGVRVPADRVLGQLGLGGKQSVEVMNQGRIGIGAQMVGLAQGALD
ncbi:MAG: acyl-CoA dehydrogenase family protein, partial [Holophagales bacterium]|nr:acyl-CoA dehydrogenase family protein [Holophagales bacterium]